MEKYISPNRRSGLNTPRNRCKATGIVLQKRMALGSFSLFGEERDHTASAVIALWNVGSVGCTTFDGEHLIMMRGRVTPHIPERAVDVAFFGRTNARTLLPSRWRRSETKNSKASCCFRKQNDLGRTGSGLKKRLE